MTVTGDTFGIGDLARLTGVPVRTIRFYCDEGVLESRRSAGGHRRFDAGVVERLRLVRRLRGLGLSLPAITDVLAGRRSLAEAVTAERAALDVELAALAWRRASLRAVEEAGPADRPVRLDLLAAVQDGAAAHDSLVAFWRRLFVTPLRQADFDLFIEMNVPRPPADPVPGQVVAYAELVTLVADRSLTGRLLARSRANHELISDETALLAGIGEACELVDLRERPRPGRALDRFVDANAAVRGRRDTPAFRRELHANAALDRDPRLRRYWDLVGEVTGAATTVGALHAWLLDALEQSVVDSR